jgi:uncharacterized protein YlxW (UPF0749 family)
MEGLQQLAVTHSDRPRTAQRGWLWQVIGLALFLGILLGASLRAQQNFKDHKIYTSRYGVPPSAYREQLKRNEEMQAEVTSLNADKSRLETLVSESGAGSKKMQALNKELQDTKAFAGLAPVSGPGVIVTLRDAPKGKVKALTKALGVEYSPEEYIIHDMDIFQLVNELRTAGAEAIAINDQRITATSPIRCEGPTIRINWTQVGVPLKIQAIGDPVALSSGLQMAGGVMDPAQSTLAAFGMVSLSKETKIDIPAYGGITTFKYGRTTNPSAGTASNKS